MATSASPKLNLGPSSPTAPDAEKDSIFGIKEPWSNSEMNDDSSPKQSGAFVKCKHPIVVGKRRGGKLLPTGVIKKPKGPQQLNDARSESTDYLTEVRRYQELTCTEELKRTSLVK